jgi:periplasmic divalent cation tolerance protein
MGELSRPPVVVLVTGPDEATLTSIAEHVVEEGLAACMNIVPGVRSVYRWNDAVETEQEALGIIKTTRSAVPALERRVLAMHPYSTPEFLVLSVDSGNPAYVGWIVGSVLEEADS